MRKLFKGANYYLDFLLDAQTIQGSAVIKGAYYSRKYGISKKAWFCYQCSLQFDSSQVYDVHLKLLHQQIIEANTIKNESYEELDLIRGPLFSNVKVFLAFHRPCTYPCE